MTEAEKLAQHLESYAEVHNAAFVREQEAKIKRMSEALRNIWSNDYISYRHNLKINHADALRDAGVTK